MRWPSAAASTVWWRSTWNCPVGRTGQVRPWAKVTGIVGGMAAGADSIDDLNVLRHGAMSAVFAGLRAPATLGTFLRTFTHGHALQLHAVHRRFLANLAAHTPLLPGADVMAFIDIDSTHKRVYGRAKQGAEYGRERVIPPRQWRRGTAR
jgi:hypothetical protein